VRVAADVADRLNLDRLIWVPARVSPFKRAADVTASEVRLEMVGAVVDLDPRFEVDGRELRRSGPSYTVDTLEEFRAEFPDAELYLVVGADQFADFPRWREPERIARIARIAVMDRGGRSARALVPEVDAAVPGLAASVVFVPVTSVDVSSTDVRAAIARGQDPVGNLPRGVAEVIRARGLYRG
jgi:nicotinate-nucleotide adenylyltransferase